MTKSHYKLYELFTIYSKCVYWKITNKKKNTHGKCANKYTTSIPKTNYFNLKKNYFVTVHTCHFFNISLPSSHLNSNHTQTKKKGAPETSVSCNLLNSYAYTADSHSDCDGVHHGNKTDCWFTHTQKYITNELCRKPDIWFKKISVNNHMAHWYVHICTFEWPETNM